MTEFHTESRIESVTTALQNIHVTGNYMQEFCLFHFSL